MYSAGASSSTVDDDIRQAVQLFFNTQTFGTAIQLSDILSAIHSVTGVDNVRWSYEPEVTGGGPYRVVEANRDGTPTALGAVHNYDFFLRDDELPTLPTGRITDDSGEIDPSTILKIRPRAQNTWLRA